MNEQPNYFLDQLFRPSETDLFTFPDIMLAMTVSALLTFVMASVYRFTHRGTSYSQSFLLTMFLMAVATAVVMMIIGSNIARAFSLVGALSIIRFRTPVKDPRDLAYLFTAVISGMGCGTGFYLASISMTAFVSSLALALYAFNYGIKGKLESILRVTYKVGSGTLEKIESQIKESFAEHKLINRILDFGDGIETNVYVVKPSRSTDAADIEETLKKVDGIEAISIYQSDQHAPF
jgi:uncharacterized membrane protein YhiD involved in acid resistance